VLFITIETIHVMHIFSHVIVTCEQNLKAYVPILIDHLVMEIEMNRNSQQKQHIFFLIMQIFLISKVFQIYYI